MSVSGSIVMLNKLVSCPLSFVYGCSDVRGEKEDGGRGESRYSLTFCDTKTAPTRKVPP